MFTTHQVRERIDHGLRVVVVREGTRLDDPVLRAVLLGGCRTVADVLAGGHHARGRWAIAGLRWSVWRCGLPGPSVDRLQGLVTHPLRTRRADTHARRADASTRQAEARTRPTDARDQG